MTLIELLILDVDGVLTDGRLAFGSVGEPQKSFFTRDGHAIKTWQRSGGRIALLSGRREQAITNRAAELGIEIVRPGVKEKLPEYEKLTAQLEVEDAAVAYMGDDLPDIPVMNRVGYPVAVADAASEVKRVAVYVTRRPGGGGAVAEVIELILRRQGRWSTKPSPVG